MADIDAFQENINGVAQLIESGLNKNAPQTNSREGVVGDYEDDLELKMDDEELIRLAIQWTNNNAPYDAKILARANINKANYLGLQHAGSTQNDTPVGSNILFEAEETYIPQAIAKNPEPVVYSDNTPEGKQASNELKTMLQYHAKEMKLKRLLGMMVRHESIYFIGVLKHGWDPKIKDVISELRKPKNFILDKDGYIDVTGAFCGQYLGEKIESTARELIDLYPDHKEYITIKVGGKLGTPVLRTEWWTDEYCFTTYEDKVLDKHKNEFWNYDKTEEVVDAFGNIEEQVTKGNNHFAKPVMPYTFLSVFSLQEQPHDVTTLIEQNIKNQARIIKRDEQIDKNLETNNNSIVVSDTAFNQETAHQAAKALQDGDPILVSGDIDKAIKRVPANDLPGGIMQSQESAKDTLRGVFGVQGLTAQAPTDNTTAHGMVLNQEYDSTRVGGGVGDAIEAVAENVFNWWTQLYFVFYDQEHYASVLGTGQAIEFVTLQMANQDRKFVVTVSPNSMAPRDELSEQQNAINLANNGWLDPINLFKKLNDADPMNTAKMVTMFKLDPMAYLQQFFPQEAMQMQAQQQQQMMMGGGLQPPVGQEPDISANMAAPNDLTAETELGRQAPLK